MTNDQSRTHFYERLRWALRKGRHDEARAREPLFPALEGEPRWQTNGGGPAPEVLESFERELLGAGATFTRLSNREALRSAIDELARAKQVRSAVAGSYPILERLGVVETLRAAGVEVRSWSLEAGGAGASGRLPHAGVEELKTADLGLTGVDWAIAETGTLVIFSRPGRPRLTSLVPPIHLAVMTPESLLTGVEDFFAGLRPAYLNDAAYSTSAITLITGSSRTGDIEHKLTRGVHGPKEVHVLYWEGDR